MFLCVCDHRGSELRGGKRISVGGGIMNAVSDIHHMGVPQHIRVCVDSVLAARVSERMCDEPLFPLQSVRDV